MGTKKQLPGGFLKHFSECSPLITLGKWSNQIFGVRQMGWWKTHPTRQPLTIAKPKPKLGKGAPSFRWCCVAKILNASSWRGHWWVVGPLKGAQSQWICCFLGGVLGDTPIKHPKTYVLNEMLMIIIYIIIDWMWFLFMQISRIVLRVRLWLNTYIYECFFSNQPVFCMGILVISQPAPTDGILGLIPNLRGVGFFRFPKGPVLGKVNMGMFRMNLCEKLLFIVFFRLWVLLMFTYFSPWKVI